MAFVLFVIKAGIPPSIMNRWPSRQVEVGGMNRKTGFAATIGLSPITSRYLHGRTGCNSVQTAAALMPKTLAFSRARRLPLCTECFQEVVQTRVKVIQLWYKPKVAGSSALPAP